MKGQLSHQERSSLLEGLESSDDEMRRLAVERLLSLPALDAIPRLVESLGDLSWRVRKAAVEQLVTSPESELVENALITALADGENPGRRNSAVAALVARGEQVTPKLIDALGSDDIDVRKLVVDTVAGIGGELARGAMLESLRDDPDTNVRAAAADALAGMPGGETESVLRSSAVDVTEDQLVRFSALRALVDLEAEIPVSELSGVLEDPMLCASGFALLGVSDDEQAAASLLKGLSANARKTREACMQSLLRVLSRVDGKESDQLITRIRETVSASDRLLPTSIERIEDADLADKLVLVQFLGLLGAPECVLAILQAGRDEAIFEVACTTLEALGETAEVAVHQAWEALEISLRRDACRFLGRTGGIRGEDCLTSALASPDSELRTAAATALGERRCAAAIPLLVRQLERSAMGDELEAEAECAAIIDALAETASPQRDGLPDLQADIVSLLADRLLGADEEVRLAMASVVGRIARDEDAELLANLVRDPSSRVRRAAVDAMAHLKSGSGSESIRLALADESPLVRVAASTAIAALDQAGALRDLERLVDDEDWRVRAAAMRAVGSVAANSSDPESRRTTLAMIERGLADEGAVAVAAVEALRQIGGLDAARVAAGLFGRSEPELVQAAVSCVGVHGDLELLLDLLSLVSHQSWVVRAEAIQSLGERGLAQAMPPILRRLETEQDGFVRDTILRVLQKLEARTG